MRETFSSRLSLQLMKNAAISPFRLFRLFFLYTSLFYTSPDEIASKANEICRFHMSKSSATAMVIFCVKSFLPDGGSPSSTFPVGRAWHPKDRFHDASGRWKNHLHIHFL